MKTDWTLSAIAVIGDWIPGCWNVTRGSIQSIFNPPGSSWIKISTCWKLIWDIISISPGSHSPTIPGLSSLIDPSFSFGFHPLLFISILDFWFWIWSYKWFIIQGIWWDQCNGVNILYLIWILNGVSPPIGLIVDRWSGWSLL